MKIAVLGAGAIGGLVAAYLKLKGADVSLVARPEAVKVIAKNGLSISGARGDVNVKIEVADRLNYRPGLLILATKTQDIDEALRQNLAFIPLATILTTQNGVQADTLVAKYVRRENIVSSIVMFGATSLEPGKVLHNFEREWVIGKAFSAPDAAVMQVKEVLSQAFSVAVAADIQGMKYLKVFVNSNNCIPGILGKSMQEAFSDVDISRVCIAIWKEGLDITTKSGIKLVSLPDFPLERMLKLTSLPIDEAAKIFCGIMTNLSKEPLYGSILQSIKRGRLSEIDYINGEFVALAAKNGLSAALNKKLVEMVHIVEKTNKFFTKEELLSEVEGLMN
jgi:2-dehydropantoate 2-reductase